MHDIDILLSLPPASAAAFEPWNEAARPAFVTSDPPGRQLGSGGGTAHLLTAAWRQSGAASWADWLAASRKLIVHGSGQSRRLPAYAAEGKPLLPLPLLPGAAGQSVDQRLLDAQVHSYRRIFRHAPAGYRLMVACGDVLLRTDAALPRFPDADILIVGIGASPEEASHHGVMFGPAEDGAALRFFLQKPTPERIRELSADHLCHLDTGVWLFSARALDLLLRRCGWSPEVPAGTVQPYELFDRFATALGSEPAAPDAEISALRAAVLPLPAGRFYHFGTNRSVLRSVAQLADPADARRSYGHEQDEGHGRVVLQHAQVACELGGTRQDIWIESCEIPADWRLTRRHVLTGIPANDWALALPPGLCLDVVPLAGETHPCLRVYGFDDAFRGRLDDAATLWMGRPVSAWLAARGLTAADAGLAPGADLQDAALFPRADPAAPATPALLRWMIAEAPPADGALAESWCRAPRLSAAALLRQADPARRQAQRLRLLQARFAELGAEAWTERCSRLDLEDTARLVRRQLLSAPPPLAATAGLAGVHDAMFRARLGADDRAPSERLRALMVERLTLTPVQPTRHVLEDQIVWGRAPVRLDLAGGWTDTPPYCLEHGGRVVNVAVDLNGQPPIQAFARVCEQPHIVLHSIDLGITETIRTYEELLRPAELGGGFGIARAALRLAGFDPRFHAGTPPRTLARLLERGFGGGIEINMLAAIPKGSGLGTSSILAATILGTLGELGGLNWSAEDLFIRTLVLEQVLGSGGGWQDQVGGLIGGLKRIETAPGLVQRPVVRWLPAHCLAEAIRDRRVALYYTGLTRVAHNILGEIVRGIFLNDAPRIATIEEIGYAADFAADALQRQSWEGLCEAVRRSWTLNQALDSGTNPEAVREILARMAPWLEAAKLLGAGGGGYLLILARDPAAASEIRRVLTERPPNPRARFVDLSISETGLQVTRS